MAELKAAGLARSLAGHDKGELYIIISVQGNMLICRMASPPLK